MNMVTRVNKSSNTPHTWLPGHTCRVHGGAGYIAICWNTDENLQLAIMFLAVSRCVLAYRL